MATTYTQNLNLGLQLDKTDYVNWDLIQQNWRKIDEAVGGVPAPAGSAAQAVEGANRTLAGISDAYNDTVVDCMEQDWEQGGARSNGDFDYDSDYLIRCPHYFEKQEATSGALFVFSGSTELQFKAYWYNGQYGLVASSISYQSSGLSKSIPSSAQYVRLVIQRKDGHQISTSDLQTCTIEGY